MIKNFYVENFCSIMNRVDISFEASPLKDETSYNNFFDFQGKRILKAISFYGMNASGKSTIIRSFAALRDLVIPLMNVQRLPGFQNAQLSPQIPYSPFEFSKTAKHKPTNMGIEFSLNNDDKSPLYRYYVSYDARRIIEERFEKMTSQRSSLLFKRTTNEKGESYLSLGSSVSNTLLLNSIAATVMPSRTFLSMFSGFRNIPDFSDAYQFFAERLVNVSIEVTRFDDLVPNGMMANEELKEFTRDLLRAADFDIEGFEIKKTSKRLASPLPFSVPEKNTLFMVHKGNSAEDRSIEFFKESLGTKKIAILAQFLFPVLRRPSVLIVDELESSLHPDLTRLILKCFLDETINVCNSQLVFSSHETSLLDLDLLRRDQINFVYKDDDCVTSIRSLNDFHVRKTDSIEKSYLAGRYSTSPSINESLLMKK